MEAQDRTAATSDITHWLADWGAGDGQARDRLLERLYGQLRRLVGRHRNRRPGAHTLQTTELIHELYLQLDAQRRVHWQDRRHFFAVAGRLLRRVVVDAERRRGRRKRGGGQAHEPLEDALGMVAEASLCPTDVLSLDQALVELEAIDPRAARVVELRYFVGLSHDETAAALEVGPATVTRSWRFARAWLRGRLEGPAESAPAS